MRVPSISRAGIIFIIYLFSVLVAFFVLSVPINAIWTAFEDTDMDEGEHEKDQLIARIRSVMTIFWALFMALPMTWLISKVFSREPIFNRYRRS